MNKKLKKYLSNGAFVLILLGILGYFISFLFNINYYVVLTSSMEPMIKTRSIVVCKVIPQDQVYQQIKLDDVIVFTNDAKTTVTHQVVIIEPNNDKIITKGLNSVSVDAPIKSSNVIGKVLFSIPYLGYLINQYVLYILIALIVFYLSFVYFIKEIKTK